MKANHSHSKASIRRRFAACLAAVLLLLSPNIAAHAADIPTQQTVAEARAAYPYAAVPVYIDGVRCQTDAYLIENGVSYLPLRKLAEQLIPDSEVYWDSKNGCAVVKTDTLTLTAKPGDCYIIANGRYLALSLLHPAENKLVDGVTYIPLRTAVRAMGGEINWNADEQCVEITRGSGTITPGDSYYREDEVYWLSRIIYAESGA